MVMMSSLLKTSSASTETQVLLSSCSPPPPTTVPQRLEQHYRGLGSSEGLLERQEIWGGVGGGEQSGSGCCCNSLKMSRGWEGRREPDFSVALQFFLDPPPFIFLRIVCRSSCWWRKSTERFRVQSWSRAEDAGESVRRPSLTSLPALPPRPGPLHALLWSGQSPESTASICE